MTHPAPVIRPNFRAPEFLRAHMQSIMDFYHPRCINRQFGGYYNCFLDDGSVCDPHVQHLVSTTRFIFNYSTAARVFGREDYVSSAEVGLRYLSDKHCDHKYGGYYWTMQDDRPDDRSKTCYGHAFVLLAYASAARAGIAGAIERVGETFDLLEARFWRDHDSAYVDEISEDWTQVSPYRGQNANMHMTEAMLAAFEATGEVRYLDRAERLAHQICVVLAEKSGGTIWEHYREDWSVDWDYNRDDPHHLFKPYGFLPGHLTEWTKLLLILERHRPLDWILPKAVQLYDTAVSRSADLENGGMHYSYAPDGTLLDRDKYHWVHCETLPAAAGLALRCGSERFWQDYDRLWAYSWRHLIDHENGGWFRVLSPEGVKRSPIKSPPGKTDYHPFGACHEVLRILGEET